MYVMYNIYSTLTIYRQSKKTSILKMLEFLKNEN